MTATLRVPVHRRADHSRGSDLAATVVVLDGRRAEWRADGLAGDRDVTAWFAGALTGLHPDYASLWWADLTHLRLQRRN